MDHDAMKSGLSRVANEYEEERESESYRAAIATALVDETLERVLVFLGDKSANTQEGYETKIEGERDDGHHRATPNNVSAAGQAKRNGPPAADQNTCCKQSLNESGGVRSAACTPARVDHSGGAVPSELLSQTLIKGRPVYYWLRACEADEETARTHIQCIEQPSRAEFHSVCVREHEKNHARTALTLRSTEKEYTCQRRSSAMEPATKEDGAIVDAKLMNSPVERKTQKKRVSEAHSGSTSASTSRNRTHDQNRLRQLTHRLVSEEEVERVLLYLMEDRAQREAKSEEKKKRRRVGAVESGGNANELEQLPLSLRRPPAGSVKVALEGRLAIAACQSLQKDTSTSAHDYTNKRITSANENEKKSLSESNHEPPSDHGERRKHGAAVLFVQRVGKGYLLRRGPCGIASVGSRQNKLTNSKEEASESAKPLPLFVRSEKNTEGKTEDRPAALLELSQADPTDQESDPIGRVRRKLAAHRRAAFPTLTPHPEFSPHRIKDKKSPSRPHSCCSASSFLATHAASTSVGSPASGSPPPLMSVPPIHVPIPLSPYRNPRLAPIATSLSSSKMVAGRPHSPSSSLSVYSKEGLASDANASADLVIAYDRKAASDVAAKERRERERRLVKVQLSAASSHMKEAIEASKKYEAMKRRREEHAREWATIRERSKVEARRGAAEEKKKLAAEEASRMRELDQREVDEVETHIALRMRVLGESRLVALKKTLVEVPGAARVASMSPSLSLSKAERGSSPARTRSP